MTGPPPIDPALGVGRERLERAVSSSNTVIYMLRLDVGGARMDWVSANVSRLTGYSEREVYEDGFFEKVLHPDDASRILAKQATLAERGHQALEYRTLHRDGRYVWVRDTRRLLRDASGQPEMVVGAMIDITEQKSLEAQLLQAQKMEAIGKVTGGVAHDFNNILTAILATASFALRTPGLSRELRGDLEVISDSAKRAADITRQLLAFARKQVIRPRRVDLNVVIGNLMPMLERAVGAGVTIRTDLSATGTVEADPVQLEHVLLNLVVNARDAMPDGGAVTLATRDAAGLPADADGRVSTTGAFSVLEVRDTGIGMDAATQARMLEPFFTTKEIGQGSGLGLAAVHGIVEQSDGHLFVTSGPGEGSSFSMYFQSRAREVDRPVAGAVSAAPPGSEAILVVEDVAGIRAPICRALRAAGYQVLEATHGMDALTVLEQHRAPVHLVLTDIVMPEMTGTELVGKVRTWYPGMKVLFISAYSEELVRVRGALPPGTAFMSKPFMLTELVARVRQLLDERASQAVA